MFRILPFVIAGLFLLLAVNQPASCQQATPDLEPPDIASSRPVDSPQTLFYPAQVLKSPADPAIVEAIRRACGRRRGELQLRLASGAISKGKVPGCFADEAFEFLPHGSHAPVQINYRDVISVSRLSPRPTEIVLEVAEFAGMAVLSVVAIPFTFLMGMTCDFSCS